jgi:hypothetical protein
MALTEVLAQGSQGPIRRRGSLVLPLVTVLWATAMCGAFSLLAFHEFQTGVDESVVATSSWPAGSQLPSAPQATLVMMAHPYCACTEASLEELKIITDRAKGQLRVFVLFLRAQGTKDDWSRTRYWDKAVAIAGVTVLEDLGGAEARRFGVSVSGEMVLFDPRGVTLFHGGITPTRGHAGDNQGRQRVLAALAGATSDPSNHAAYGCPITADGQRNRPVRIPAAVRGSWAFEAPTRMLCNSCHDVQRS